MPWQQNQSGNPKGRKKLSEEEKQNKEKFTSLLKASVPEALKTLLEIMHNPETLSRDRISCARTILEKAYGSVPLLVNEEEKDNVLEIRVVRGEKNLNKSKGNESADG